MTEERFLTLAGAYGADLRRWPAAERAAAAAFAAANPSVARTGVAAERRLDDVLDGYADPAPSPALRDRVIFAAKATAARGRRAWRWMAGAGLGLGLASSAVAGAVAGYTVGHPAMLRLTQPAAGDADEVSSLADPAGDAANG
ncbi:MAG TPA: hypothetical protein VFE13_02920 [Caulobacteraceae bacterium]|jgi:anti-sigma-K factor RskA|nr:hypothetical protein [Caulobacteraceae bacterium]